MKTSYPFPPTQRRSSQSALSFLFSAAVVVTTMAVGIVNAVPGAGGGPPPVVVDSIQPVEIVQGQVPQPEIQVFGSNFIEGLPSETNRPTVTLRQPGKGGAEFSALAWVNFSGTVATVPASMMNLLQAPLGVYDVIVTRPTDDASATLKGAFTVTDDEPDPGEIALMVRSIWGGPVNEVEVVGNLAYAAIGRRLVILNVADPANPFEVGSLNLGGVNDLAVRDGYAFVGANDAFGFSVVDVSDPSNPSLVWAMSGGARRDVHLWGDFAFVRGHTGSVQLFDLTDPQNTAYVDDVVVGNVGAMVVVGDLMYVGTSIQCCLAELKIYDLASDPLNPVLLGSLNNVGEKTTALAIEGNFAYWTVRHNGGWFSLEVVDVSIPASPTIVASETGFVWVRDVAVSGGYLYVADATDSGDGTPSKWAFAQGLVVFDIADPANPTVVSTFKTHGDVQGVKVVGERAYLHDAGEGLIILDVSDPTNPVRLGNYHSPATLRQMDKVGDVLYVADAWNGFTILDVTDASHPQVLGVYLAEHYNDLGVDARGIDVQDDLVYLGAGHLGLEVVDVSDPAYPALVGAFRIPSGVPACSTFAAVTVWGGDPRYASIGFEQHSCGGVTGVFLNVDVTNPQDMFEAGRLTHGTPRASKIALNEQGIAFLGRSHPIYSGGQELTLDTSDPDPLVVYWGEIELVTDTALAGDETLLYLASSDHVGGNQPTEGLYIQDVTDPANPVVLLHLDEDYPFEDGDGDSFVLSSANAVATQNQRVYVAASLYHAGGPGGAFGVLDMADPTTPVLLDFVGRAEAGGPFSAVWIDEPHVFVTNESETASAGLAILELVGLLNPADLDGDGSVGASDLLILLANWGPCPPKGGCTADLNDDGSVGAADLLILLANWG